MRLMDTIAARLNDAQHARDVLRPQLCAPTDGDWRLDTIEPQHCRRRISRRLITEGGPWLDLVWTVQWRAATGRSVTEWWQGRMDARPGGIPGALRLSRVDTEAPWAGFLGDGGQIVRIEPGEHCTARFAGTPQRPAHFGKCYADARVDHARAILSALHRGTRTRRDAFYIGAPIDAEPGCLRQLTVTGEDLAACWIAGRDVERPLVASLADLARHGPDAGQTLTRQALLEDAAKWCKKLRLADPTLHAALVAVMRRLDTPPTTQAPMVPTHGDCHADQMLWHAGRIALFDYDNLCQAEAGRDLADFISQLLCRFDGYDWLPQARALAEGWALRCPDLHHPEVFDWHLRTLLLRKAYSQFVRARSGWQARCRHALSMAANAALGRALFDKVCA